MSGFSFRPPTSAESLFRRGLALCQSGRFHEALAPLEQAMALSVEEPGAPYQRRLRSYYGLCLTFARRDLARGRKLCEEAIADGSLDAELYANLARVYQECGRKDLTVEALNTTLAIDPHHQSSTLFDQLGRRRPPVFRFLSRRHLFNKWAGKIRHRFFSTP